MTIKVLGVVLVIVALAAAIIPAFNNCSAEGMLITTKAGKQIPMKCYWTSRAAIGTAIPLAAVGMMMVFSKRKESQTMLAATGGLLSVVAIALPTALIGVCTDMSKSCLTVMQPSLIFLGVLGVGLCTAVGVFAQRRKDDAEIAL